VKSRKSNRPDVHPATWPKGLEIMSNRKGKGEKDSPAFTLTEKAIPGWFRHARCPRYPVFRFGDEPWWPFFARIGQAGKPTAPADVERAVYFFENYPDFLATAPEGAHLVVEFVCLANATKIICAACERLGLDSSPIALASKHPEKLSKGSRQVEAVLARLRVRLDAQAPADGPWSEPNSPSQWARVFRVSTQTIRRRFKEGKIRSKKYTAKSYAVHVDDLPKASSDPRALHFSKQK
jgi:hypothetical protein